MANLRPLLCLPSHREWGRVGIPLFAQFVLSVLCLRIDFNRAGSQTRDVDPMLGKCWPIVYVTDGWPTLT